MGTPRSQSKIQPNFPDCTARLLRYFMPKNRHKGCDRAYSDWQMSPPPVNHQAHAERVRSRSSRSAASQTSYAAAYEAEVSRRVSWSPSASTRP
jgi:hypothetical protein